MITAHDFLGLRKLASLAKHEPGRLTLKVSPAIISHPLAAAVKGMSGGVLPPQIKKAKFNMFGMSLDVEYDADAVNPADIDGFFSNDDTRAVACLRHVANLFGIHLEDGEPNAEA